MDLELKYITGADGKRKLTIPDEIRARVASYLRGGGAGTAAGAEAIVQEGQDALLLAVSDLTERQAAYKPSADDWSVLELMAHVVSTKLIVAGLCRNLSEGHWPPGIGAEFEEESAQDGVTVRTCATLAEARAAAQAAHDDLIAFIRDRYETADTETRFKHFVFGPLNAREWAIFQRIHDGDHTPQIASIKTTPGFPEA
jgi:hypothetical protein